jgi:TPR repeat protein
MKLTLAMVCIVLLGAACAAAPGKAMADSYEEGRAALLRGDYATAWTIWKRSAGRGEAGGENGMGILYNFGDGVPQDIDKAIQWYQRAVDQGFPKAEYNLGMIYESDQWGRANHAEAMRLLESAAKNGFAPAQFELGEIYHDGRGVPRDDAKALSYYRMAADRHFGYAQDAIGYMYMEGDGVAKDRVAAYAWFALAADSKDDPARGIAAGDLEFITGQMSAAEIDAARQRVESCRQPELENCP